MENIFVVKIGGSVLSLKDKLFDFQEAQRIKEFFNSVDSNLKFVLITGGGNISREYQQLLKDNNYPEYDQHYIGTVACNMNAVMLRSVFGNLAEDKILGLGDLNSDSPIKFNKRFLIAGAGQPGPSSDWDATWLAKRLGAKQIVTLKDIDAVYSEDPDKNPNAKRLSKVDWDEYLGIIGNPEKHTPGANLPVDPIAARLAKENGITFYVVSGMDFENLKNLLTGNAFIGTEIN